MTENEKNNLKGALYNEIEHWLGKTEGQFGWLGESTADLMTDAAFNILLAMKDCQDYIKKEGISSL
jgi:hypothetical protein